VVLFASQPAQRLVTDGGRRTALRALAQAAAETGAQVVIKAHPLEDVSALRRLAAETGLHAPIVEGQLYEWLLACDVMATISSTVVYEAAVAERPALLLEWSGNPDVAGYVGAGIGCLPETPEQTGAALRALLSDETARAAMLERQQAFAQHHLAVADGRASERLAALARRLIEGET
jgi:NAD(P)-dependent dehydrogenase (short-subunit alcohol dehydrogenase family)